MGEWLYLCAGCGEPAKRTAKTNCQCVTNVLFCRDDPHDRAIKDRYFMEQIDTAGDRWAAIKRQREQNLNAVSRRYDNFMALTNAPRD